MAAKIKANSRLTEELLEIANDMRERGLLSKASHDKIIKRSFRGATTSRTRNPENRAALCADPLATPRNDG
jgi:hypothetical protein